jgi:hypothetical protein
MHRQALILCVAISAASCALAADGPARIGGSVMPGVAAPMTPSARQWQPQPGQALNLDVYPRMILARSDAWVRMRIEPDARSRSVLIEWESADGDAGNHLIQLDGGEAPIRFDFPLKRMTPGAYDIVATLRRSDGTRVVRATTLTVYGR